MRRVPIVTWIKIIVGIVAFGLLQIGIVHALSPTAMRFGLQRWPDASGFVGNWSPYGAIKTSGPFFQPLGTNGRACVTCHQPRDGWSITPAYAQGRFAATAGRDPLFRTIDGATSPRADVSTVAARRRAYRLLLNKGLFRVHVGNGFPAHAQFTLVTVSDPYGYASARHLSLFRRPLPTTNLPFLSTVMWDGRETVQPMTGTGHALQADLAGQASDIIQGPEQATHAPTTEMTQQIVSFELGLFTAQDSDVVAGDLTSAGALGGPQKVYRQPVRAAGIHGAPGSTATEVGFTGSAFTLFQAWLRGGGRQGAQAAARTSIARGEALFNTKRFAITGVAGLNDVLGVHTLMGTCTSCHDAQNIGSRTVNALLNIGTSDYPARPGLDLSGLPVYSLLCRATGIVTRTTDPGRALITGKCQDIGKFKVPGLRGLAARPPYFHNGSAATLEQVVAFYNRRFDIGFTARDTADLVAFLRSL